MSRCSFYPKKDEEKMLSSLRKELSLKADSELLRVAVRELYQRTRRKATDDGVAVTVKQDRIAFRLTDYEKAKLGAFMGESQIDSPHEAVRQLAFERLTRSRKANLVPDVTNTISGLVKVVASDKSCPKHLVELLNEVIDLCDRS